ncbi:hypothetical protein EV361DRAFT_462126 [Lentinula raphanica]|nr:hypothetical protein EV361DRAFT_462126 [Lentinula raphanica]
MRLNNLIPTFLLSLPLFCSPVDARRRHKGTSLAQHEREVFTQRQYRPQNLSSRDLIDICINLDAVVDGNPLLEGLFAGVHLCLCLKDLDIFLDTYVDLDLLGLRTLVEAELRTFFHSQPPCKPVPAHAHRACTTEDPCSCSCDPGYTKVGDECVCPAPNSVCNGVCGYFPHGCGGRPSALPRSVKKRVNQEITFADAQAYCGDKSVCGVPGGSEHAFECLDTKSNPESCGGCLYAHPWSQTNAFVAGTDCSTVSSPQAVSHRCENGQCVVETCAQGYIRGPGGCVPSSRIVPRMAFGGPGAASSPSSRSTSANDIIADLTPLANAGVNLGPGLNNAVTGLSEGLGLGKVIYSGELVNGKREEDCDGSGSSGSVTSKPPSPSSSAPPAPSWSASTPPAPTWSASTPPAAPSPTQPASPSKSDEPCPDSSDTAPSNGDGSSSGNDIIADLSPLAIAGVNLGPGLDSATTGLAGGLGLGKVVYPGQLINGKRDEDCDCEDGSGSSALHSTPPSIPSPTPSSGSGSGSSSCPSGPQSGNPSSSGSSGSDIIADLSPLTKVGVNLGPGLDSAVTGLSEGLGLGKVIYPGQLVNGKREEDCDGDGSSGSVTSKPPSPSSSAPPAPSWSASNPPAPTWSASTPPAPTWSASTPPATPSPTQPASPSKSDEPCPDNSDTAPSNGDGSSSGNDIIADLSPLAIAGVNLGPGLDSAVTGLAGGLGLGKVVYPGQLVNEKREEDCDCEDGSGSSAPHSTPPSIPSPTPSSGSGSGSSSCPSGSQSGTSSSSGSGSASGSDIIADLSPLAKAGVNLGPGLNSAVTGLSAGLGLGKVIYPGQLVSGKREEDCDGDGSSGSTIPATSPSPTPTQPAPPSKSEEPCPDDSGSASSTGDGSGNDIVADLSPLAKAGVNLGPGLNSAVTGISEGLGLGKVIYPGKLVNDKREEDCDCEEGDGSSTPPPPTRPTRPPTPSSTSTSLPPHGSGSGSSSACPSGSGTASSSSGSSSSSGNDIVADLSPLTKANVNLGSGLNSAVTGTAGGLGLGEVIYPGELVNEKREEAKSSSGSGSSSSSGIVTDLSPLTKVGVDLGPGLDSAVTGLAGGLGLGKVIYSGGLVNA